MAEGPACAALGCTVGCNPTSHRVAASAWRCTRCRSCQCNTRPPLLPRSLTVIRYSGSSTSRRKVVSQKSLVDVNPNRRRGQNLFVVSPYCFVFCKVPFYKAGSTRRVGGIRLPKLQVDTMTSLGFHAPGGAGRKKCSNGMRGTVAGLCDNSAATGVRPTDGVD